MSMDIDYDFEKRSRGGMDDIINNAKRRKIAADAQYVATLQAMPRSSGYSKGSYGNPLARKGYMTVPRTRGVYAQGEMKYFDSELALKALTASTDWTGTEIDPDTVPVANINTLFCPTQGSGISQRIGKSCKVHKIKIRGIVQFSPLNNQTAGKFAASTRLLLVQDMQTNGTQAQGEQVMGASVTASAATNFNSWQNINNFGRFKVLKDKIINIKDPNGFFDGTNIEVNGKTRHFKWTINFREPIPVRFNATNGGTIADIVDNSLHLIATCNSITLAPSVTYQCRVCFKE